ncbi:hypothetical protein ABPG72_001322 [Tetrahymena utriculariae]
MSFKFLQRLVEITTFIILLLGIFWIVFSAILYSKDKDVTDNSKYDIYRGALILGIAFGSLLVIWAIIGLIGACKKNNCLLGTFNFGIFLFLLISIAILVLSIIFAVYLPDYKNDRKCTQKSLLIDLKTLNDQSYQALCQNSCQCNFKGTPTQALQQDIINYSEAQGALRVQDCQIFKNFGLSNQNSNSDLLRAIENTFDCSGFCSINKYYVFSNVNNGFPSKDCKVEMINFLDNNNKRVIIAAAVLTFFLFLTFILSICLCVKKPKGENFYERNKIGQYNNK